MRKAIKYFVLSILMVAITIYNPLRTSHPAASPDDLAKEDLSRVLYPSTRSIAWKPVFIRPQDSLESLYGKNWVLVARFNRIDRRHVYPGMTIKSPINIDDLKDYAPMPQEYGPAKRYHRYILVNMEEQWLGAYEYGKLQFSFPAATGKNGYETPTGIFRVDARHKNHTSSLYKTEDESVQYPMDYAIRFHIGKDNVAYWIHARDLPGKPASHGCIGLFDEAMQKRITNVPENPVLQDSKKLYDWAVGENQYGPDSGGVELLENGPIVEVVGHTPPYLSGPTHYSENTKS
ncbi:MAG: L,D-transpeptidase [Geobacteraceae bacterium]|nr:L,D-transpeptidase [Geobacteraceae bacterium]